MSTAEDKFEFLESHCEEIAVEACEVPGEPLAWEIWPGDGIGGTSGFWECWTTEELIALQERDQVTVYDRRTRALWSPTGAR